MKTQLVNSLYEKLYYDGRNLSVKTITRDEFLSLDQTSVDLFLAIDLGIWSFRTQEGKWVERKLSEKSLGTTCLRILEAVQCEPGVYFTPDEIAELTGIYSLKNPNNLSARWRALRLDHDETFRKPNFFLSKRAAGMGIAWNPSKSFMQIIRIRDDR